MLFQHTWKQVLEGKKTQTRRIAKPGEWLQHDDADHERCQWHAVCTSRLSSIGGRLKWMTGNTYAVQPRRGQKAVGRIRITAIRRQDVRDITAQEASAEGFEGDRVAFWALWTLMHDDQHVWEMPENGTDEAWLKVLRARPDERYQAWVLTFELLGER